MEIGIYIDARNPPHWRRPWVEHYARILDQVVHAEELGLASVWLGEHHFFEDGYLPQPLVLAAAVAARTERIRIGTSVLLAPLRPAIDIAEHAALVDIISNGRMELGLGAGYRPAEFEAFGADITTRFGALEARVGEVRELWASGRSMPPMVQDHPRIWIGGFGPRVCRMVGRLGEGLLTLRGPSLDSYLLGIEEGGWSRSRARVSGPVNLVLARDPERAEATWRELRPFYTYQWQSYQRYASERDPRARTPGSDSIHVNTDDMRSEGPDMSPPGLDVVTPEEAIGRLSAWLDQAPVVHAYFWTSIAGMPDSIAEEHIELLGNELAPAARHIGGATRAS